MTNEEKAKSLWYHFCTEKHCVEITQNCQKCPKVQVHPQLLEMAEWKEQQYAKERKELIAKANQAVNDSHESGAQFMKERLIERAVGFLKLHMPFGEVSETLKNEVIEDFKKEMKELYNT